MRGGVLRVLLLGLVVVASGCALGPASRGPRLADGAEIPILRDVSGSLSSIQRSLRLAIHDPGTLAMLPVRIGPVDFDREMVLFAALGPTASEDYTIRITRVWRDGSVLRAAVEITYPPAEGGTSRRRASPYHAVVLPRVPMNVEGFDSQPPSRAFKTPGNT